MPLGTIQYATKSDAAVTISGCEDRSTDCVNAVVVTRNKWKTESGFMLPDLGSYGDVWTHALTRGAVAVVAKPGRQKTPLAPFIYHHSGRVTRLHVATRPRNPKPGAVLTSRPAGAPGRDGEVWVLRRAPARLFPALHQPCCRRGEQFSSPYIGRQGEVSARIERYSARTVARWKQLVVSHDHGRSWRADNGLPEDLAPYTGGYVAFAAGPGARLAVAWSSDPGTDYKRLRLFVSDDAGNSWRRVAAGRMPKVPNGMAFTNDGTLLVGPFDKRLWRLPPGALSPQPVRGAPHARYGGIAQGASGFTAPRPPGPVIVETGPVSFAVSRDGKHWKTVVPGASLAAET
jgi:hypothetical protein